MNLLMWTALVVVVVLQVLSTTLILVLVRRQRRLVKLIHDRPAAPGRSNGLESLLALQALIEKRPYVPSLEATSPQFLLAVAEHIRRKAPLHILECGAGPSTVLLAMIIQGQSSAGRLYSIEDHRGRANAVQTELKSLGLTAVATVIPVEVAETSVPDAPGQAFWYDLASLPDEVTALPIDLLIVHGPNARPDLFSRYPAGPELFPRLSPDAHIFIENDDTPQERSLSKQWRKIYPDLGVREILPEISAAELFFLDRKIDAFIHSDGTDGTSKD